MYSRYNLVSLFYLTAMSYHCLRLPVTTVHVRGEVATGRDK